jgi:hypothetical protein
MHRNPVGVQSAAFDKLLLHDCVGGQIIQAMKVDHFIVKYFISFRQLTCCFRVKMKVSPFVPLLTDFFMIIDDKQHFIFFLTLTLLLRNVNLQLFQFEVYLSQ